MSHQPNKQGHYPILLFLFYLILFRPAYVIVIKLQRTPSNAIVRIQYWQDYVAAAQCREMEMKNAKKRYIETMR